MFIIKLPLKTSTHSESVLYKRYHILNKGLSCRFKKIGGHMVQRDAYSAFLTLNAVETLISVNREACIKGFEAFIKLHDKTISELKARGISRPACFGF